MDADDGGGGWGWVDQDEVQAYADAYARGLADGRRGWRLVALALAGVIGLVAVLEAWAWIAG